MREFSAAYLAEARGGMWADDREALAALDLPGRRRILDVGCGSGSLTRALRAESAAEIVGVDADRSLLETVESADHLVAGDATCLPFLDGSFDLVTCQALLVNLPDPVAAVREFARVSSDLVAAVEPDNAAVSVESTVDAEAALARRAREAFIEGAATDVSLGAAAADAFEEAGLRDVETRAHYHAKVTEPPYSERDLEAARRKARATRLDATSDTLLAGDLDESELRALAADWRAMGEAVVDQMRRGEYRRVEVVPYHVAVGRVRA